MPDLPDREPPLTGLRDGMAALMWSTWSGRPQREFDSLLAYPAATTAEEREKWIRVATAVIDEQIRPTLNGWAKEFSEMRAERDLLAARVAELEGATGSPKRTTVPERSTGPMTWDEYLDSVKVSPGDVVEVQSNGRYLPVVFDPSIKPRPGRFLCLNCGHDPYSPECQNCPCANHWPKESDDGR